MTKYQVEQYERALRTIEQFAPIPERPKAPSMNRTQVIDHIKMICSSSTLRHATNDELATILAAMQSAWNRRDA